MTPLGQPDQHTGSTAVGISHEMHLLTFDLAARQISQVDRSAEYHSMTAIRDEKHPKYPCNEDEAGADGRFIGHGSSKWRSAAWCLLITLAVLAIGSVQHQAPRLADALRSRSPQVQARAASPAVLDVFQVSTPVLTVSDSGKLLLTDGSRNASVVAGGQTAACRETVVQYSFANSYGSPFVHDYAPPTCSFSRVTWNLTVTAAGKQFDRLAIVYLGNVEVFRTSTAEPTLAGIEWTYLKDMTPYLSLLKQDQTIIFDLGNIVNNIYTSPFNVTLTAVYFSAADSITPADQIISISHNTGAGHASVYSLPPDNATNEIAIPRNTKRAVVTLSATGQIDEEFWWSNVPSSAINTYPQSGTLLGYSPFREVQLFIDGSLAGVAWPFPIIFTGGIVPGLWRPIVGIDAFDLKEDEIDITPWLPLLCDGKQHNFTIRVAGLQDDGKGHAVLQEVVGSYWLVTGKIFVWLDNAGKTTTGNVVTKEVPAPLFDVTVSITKSADGSNNTLTYAVSAERSLSYAAVIHTSQGQQYVSWQQTRNYTNLGVVSDAGNTQTNDQHTSGLDLSSSGYVHRFEYPLLVSSAYATDADNFSIVANVSRGKEVQILGNTAVFPTGLEPTLESSGTKPLAQFFQGSSLQTTQNGSATYIANTTSHGSFSFGSTAQDITFSGVSVSASLKAGILPAITGTKELFTRQVAAVNGSVIYDHEVLLDQPILHQHSASHSNDNFLLSGRPQRQVPLQQ